VQATGGEAADSNGGAPSEQSGETLGAVVSDMLRRSLQLAVRRIGRLNRMTESGTLSTGRSLEAIVLEAQAYAQRARSTLEGIAGSDDQRGIAALIASQNHILESFIQEMRGQIERQAEVARAALRSSSQIASLGNEIGAVAFQSRLLSLNASIEAGRMGPQGRAFGVIAAEMTKLSQQVESTSKAVNELVSVLSATLPNVFDAAEEMRGTSETFITEIGGSISQVDQEVKQLADAVQQTLHAGDRCIAAILTHSQDALSSLQFQDPVAQGLVAVAKDFNHTSRAVCELVNNSPSAGRSVAGPASHVAFKDRAEEIRHVSAVANDSNAPPPGEVLLF
jgi:methyl-accepting chemotaxis protein